MKKSILQRIFSVLLVVSLTLCAMPSALAAQESDTETTSEPWIQVTLEPKYAASFIEFNGNYCTFIDYSTNKAGVCDCFGNVTMSGKNMDLTVFPNGMAAEMGIGENGYYAWAILSPTGKRLTAYEYGECIYIDDLSLGDLGWVHAYNDTKAVVIDKNGKNILKGTYEVVSAFCNKQFTYQKGGKWGVDDVNGTHILPCKYEYLRFCCADRLIYSKDGKYGIIDTKGEVLLSAEYDNIYALEDNMGYRVVRNGKEGLLSKDFAEIIPCSYNNTDCFSDNVFVALNYITHDIAFYDAKGKVITEAENVNYEYWEGGCAYLYYTQNSDGTNTYYALNAAGEWVIDGKIGKSCGMSAGQLLLENNGSIDVYDSDGRLQNNIENAVPVGWSNVALAERDGMYAVIGTDGTLSTDFVYSTYSFVYKDGIIGAKRGDRWYLVTQGGKEYPEGGSDTYIIMCDNSNFGCYRVNGYYGIFRYVGAEDSLFADVANNAWYRTAADYCSKNGLMNGTSAGKFSPDMTTTRGMLVQILYNLSGAEKPTCDNPFTDVAAGKWYTDAVLWATENGIVAGYGNGKFGPNDTVTREQIAAILYNYAKKNGKDVSSKTTLDSYPDGAKVGAWARDAMQWAVGSGLISGSVQNGKTCLDPKGKATRAMTAAILTRFAQMSDDINTEKP